MIAMIEKQQIIIGFFRQGKSKKQLARELRISIHTVRRYIALYERNHPTESGSDSVDLSKGDIVRPPSYDTSKRTSLKLTEHVKAAIDDFLCDNEKKRGRGKIKQQMQGTDIHEALLEKGFQISYRTVCRYLVKVKKHKAEVFIRQVYEAGQSTQFDWGEVKLKIDDKNKRLMLAVFTSSYSNHRWAQLFYRQDMSSFLQSHTNYFSFTKAVQKEVVYDNMRVAVKKYTLRNSDKIPTEDLLKLSTYYQFNYRFCNARRGNEKGHVERSVEFIRRKAFSQHDIFDSLEQANEHLLETCKRLNNRCIKGKQQSINFYFEKELAYMKPIKGVYDTAEIQSLRVDKYSCIRVDTNYYSIPEGHVGGFINVKIYPNTLFFYDDYNNLIATHPREHTRHSYFMQLDHYLLTLLRKPGALSGSLSLKQADHKIRELFFNHFKKRSKVFIELLLYIRAKDYSIDQLICAINRCLVVCSHQEVCPDKVRYFIQQDDVTTLDEKKVLSNKSQNEILKNCHNQLNEIQSLFSNN
jgi:transposase